ncbi:MAG TPA: CocE/NonD family hydrolase [Opitutaceae bacterium]|nr:CocE/NonD family hydrolase [Opitutaceae bacterium]
MTPPQAFPRACAALAACLLALAGAAAADPTPAPAENYPRGHYTKYEFRIAMRDGTRLFTSVYVPKDASQSWPFLITRTPYSCSPYGVDLFPEKLGPSDEFEKAGYIFVFQDVRGRYMSEGTFLEMNPHVDVKNGPRDVDDSTDLYDTLEYLLKHVPNNNGKAGIVGVSYPGFYADASMIDSHPALKAASPQAPVTDFFMMDDWYRGGAFMLSACFGFYSNFKPTSELGPPPRVYVPFDFGTPDRYKFFLEMGPLSNADARYLKGSNPLWSDAVRHDTYDAFWKARAIAPHLKNIHCAVLTVGGLFDAEDIAGPLRTYRAVRENNPGTPNKLVEGPWPHGGWARTDGDHLGDVQFDAKTSEYFRTKLQFPFFEHYLKGKGDDLPNATVFETGTNVWRTYDAWPPIAAKPRLLYLRGGGKLSFDPPGEGEGMDEYVSDPARPVPFTSYTADAVPQRYMVDDQRFAGRRPDVLVYETDPLEEDVTVAGPVSPELFVATSGTDSDFVVKLIDVYPNDYPNVEVPSGGKRLIDPPPVLMGGYEQLLRGEPMRAKFRNSWEKPEPMTPGAVERLSFTMPDVNHTFRRGHRIMVQVQSSWFPLVDRNPQTFTDIPTAKPEDFRRATEQVYHSKASPSAVGVLVLPQP